MPTKLCGEPGCPNPPTGKGRCDAHRKPIERDRSRRRREATKGVYKTRRWEMRRKQVFERDPFCADGRLCGGNLPSVHVDHVTPLTDGGAPYAMENLRGSCVPCHQLKTALENAGHTPAEVEAHREAATPIPLWELIGRTGEVVISHG